jgi:hypothetical protein
MCDHIHVLHWRVQPAYSGQFAADGLLPAHSTVEPLQEEAQFWQQLPATLAAAQNMRRSAGDNSSSDQPASSSSGR